MGKTMVNVILSRYYQDIINKLEISIKDELNNNNIDFKTTEVSGVWEIPYEINRLSNLSEDNIEFIAVGVLIEGETDHYKYISSAVTNGLINLTINNNIYIANCILNLKSVSQAEKRIKSKGLEAVNALVKVKANRNQ